MTGLSFLCKKAILILRLVNTHKHTHTYAPHPHPHTLDNLYLKNTLSALSQGSNRLQLATCGLPDPYDPFESDQSIIIQVGNQQNYKHTDNSILGFNRRPMSRRGTL